MAVVRHRVGIRGTLQAVFGAITEPESLQQWWSTTATGSAEVGQTLKLGFGGVVTLEFTVLKFEPEKRIRLDCPDGPGPWRNSQLEFVLEQADEQVYVTFQHTNEAASDDEFLYFNTKWPLYLLSLRDLIETGAGRPSPKDIPIYFGDNIKSNTV